VLDRNSPASDLPTMVVNDPRVRIVPKSDGIDAFEAAVRWAAAAEEETLP
jgi:hypothetical protein